MPAGRRIFISYARVDAWFVDPLVETLERAGHDVWIDRQDIAGGTPWASSIVEAIRGSDVAVLVITRASVVSPDVRKEVNLAGSHDLPIVPVVIPPVEIPDEIKYHIAGRNRVQVDPANPTAALARVRSAVERSETQTQRRGWHRVLGCLGVLAVFAIIVGGVITVMTGRFPPWADRPTCTSVEASAQSSPVTTPVSGALITVSFHNTTDHPVTIPARRDVVVTGSSGFQYPEEPFIAAGEWFFEQEIAPGATRALGLGIRTPGSGDSDTVRIVVPGVRESAIPILRCDITVDGVGVDFPS
jgi:hypothetical protein